MPEKDSTPRAPQRRIRKNDPDPNNYRDAEGDDAVGFTHNPVAGGAIPGTSQTRDFVNGVSEVEEEDADDENVDEPVDGNTVSEDAGAGPDTHRPGRG